MQIPSYIDAIKEYRDVTDCTLAEARDFVLTFFDLSEGVEWHKVTVDALRRYSDRLVSIKFHTERTKLKAKYHDAS